MTGIEKYLLYNMIMEISDPYDVKNYDDEVNKCLLNMYFFMISSEMSKEKREKLWKAFDNSYQKLNSKQQEIVKQDYVNIIKTQEKNKEKVKKKGNDKYE